MNGVHLRLYTYESRKHGNVLVYEWLLDQARKLGVHGGSAFKAMAGFGRHGRIHEQHFFELAGDVPVLVEFIVSEEQADRLLAVIEAEQLQLFYARVPAQFDLTGPAADPREDA